ncbi:MAG TPA: S1C family serine protease [Gemmatimonadaceae bacterium]|nr:S1C family serine protease [Gemmatimonadaceae bacterium]
MIIRRLTAHCALICLSAVASTLALAPAAGAQAQPYTLDDIVGLLKRKVTSTRVLTLAKKNCVSFSVTNDAEAKLRAAGGSPDLVEGLRSVCNPNSPKASTTDSAARVAVGAAPVPLPSAPLPIDTMVTLRLRAAIVESDLSVRPLPEMDLLLISPAGDTSHVSTDLEGRVERQVKAGVYRIEAGPQVVGNSKYRWGFFQQVAKDMGTVELTPKNATVEVIPPPPPPPAVATADSLARIKESASKKPKSEKDIFESYKSGLFTIYGSQRGSGFLADTSGLVLTDARLLEGADEVRVQTDPSTKIYGRRVVVDNARGIAVLLINKKRCALCVTLPLHDSSATNAPESGDRVLALGSPLNKVGVLALGIVSAADAKGVVSDADVNYLNSGGPLLDMSGYVVGLNSSRSATNGATARVSTAIPAAQLLDALAAARDSMLMGRARPPSDSLLPLIPREAFPDEPIAAVSSLGGTLQLQNYKLDASPFRIFMMTPQIMAWREAQATKALADRKQRDPKRAASWTQIDPIEGWRDWQDYLDDRRAVVIFNITSDKTDFPFYEPDKIQSIDDGNFRDMKLYRDNVEIVPVERVRAPAMLNAEQNKAAGKGMPMQGIYVYRIEDFAPRAAGTMASYTMVLTDASNAAKPIKALLPPPMIEQMWKDFTAYRFSRRD